MGKNAKRTRAARAAITAPHATTAGERISALHEAIVNALGSLEAGRPLAVVAQQLAIASDLANEISR